MKTEPVQSLTTNFEAHAQPTDTGIEFWLDHALFGKSTQAMKAQWKVPDTRPLADFAPTIILKAKDFATEITIFNARQHQMGTESAISSERITNNKAVRNTLISRGI
jgi:DNA-damage-inducible protein D